MGQWTIRNYHDPIVLRAVLNPGSEGKRSGAIVPGRFIVDKATSMSQTVASAHLTNTPYITSWVQYQIDLDMSHAAGRSRASACDL